MDSNSHNREFPHPLGVLCPFTNHHAQTNHHTPSWTRCTKTIPYAHQLSHLLDRCTPFLVLFLVPFVLTLRGCTDEVIQPLQCAHAAKGRHVYSSSMLPSFLVLSQMQPKSPSPVAREAGCVPPWVFTSPLCPKVLLPMPTTQVISLSITSTLCSSPKSSSNMPK
jgi:hypothetical protein